jgi:4-hydroxybenzoate polyprenyltransferase
VFYEERSGAIGWETIAMNYGAKFPSGLDPLFGLVFAAAALLNLTLSISIRQPAWIVLSLLSHVAFGYRIVSARKDAAAQRALDLDRFRSLLSK